jgi:RNA polymerase sigma-70 factor, ECF subfamily
MVDLGDRDQFERAYRRLAPLAAAIAHDVLADRAAAEDVVQDVFMRLWLNPRSYDPRRGSLRKYVAMVARSRSIDRRRAQSVRHAAWARAAGEAEVGGLDAVEGPEHVVLRRERGRAALSALGRLPRGQRDALLLAYGRGLSGREVAARTGVALGTAKSQIRLGLVRARAHLSEAA